VADEKRSPPDQETGRPRTRAGPRRSRPSEESEESRDNADPRRHQNGSPRRTKATRTLSVGQAARLAARQVAELTGRVPEGVVSIERVDDGWLIRVEVVESHRIPDSADILAIYEAELDGDGELTAYRRVRRYPRGRTQEDQE
jgi:hypothetical protein